MRCRTDGNSLSTYLDVRIFHDFFPHAVPMVAGIAWLVGFSFWTFGLTTITVPARNPFHLSSTGSPPSSRLLCTVSPNSTPSPSRQWAPEPIEGDQRLPFETAMTVLFLSTPFKDHPAHTEFVRALRGRYPMTVYDPALPLAAQFEGVQVVVASGGAVGTREMIDAALAARVKLWQVTTNGLDHVDVAYFVERGLPLANSPGPLSAIPLAEHALLMILYFAKNLHVNRAASWQRTANTELAALQVEFFGDPSQLHHVLAAADFVSLHVPLTAQTRHLIDRGAIMLMKPTAVLINVARGQIVEEEALVAALRSGRIKGAAVDVYAQEPMDPAHPLLHLDNVLTTPHVAGFTDGTWQRRSEAAAENVVRVAEGRPPLNLVTAVD